MALYNKQLHVRKNGVVTNINLYTTASETGNLALGVKDGSTTVYAKLGVPTDSLASPLRVRKNGSIYAVLTSAAEPVITPLFSYTVATEYYSAGSAGAIYGDRNASPTTYTVQPHKVTNLNGDPAIFDFFQGTAGRLVLRQYNYSPYAPNNKIIDPLNTTWRPFIAEQSWSNIANLHAAATNDRWLYATGYDLGRIAVVDMSNNYWQSTVLPTYQFPTSWPAISLPSTASCHGEGLVTVGNYLYALFYVNIGNDYQYYLNSIVVKLAMNKTTGSLIYINHLEVGKNAFTLEHFNNKLYICCVGGMQKGGSANTETCLDIVDLATFSKTTVAKTTGMIGDIRSITIADAEHAYIFMGHYDSYFGNMIGSVYHTSVANITVPASWTKVTDVKNPGYLWGLHNDSNHLWFVKGRTIEIFESLPTSPANAVKSFNTADLGIVTGNINAFNPIL